MLHHLVTLLPHIALVIIMKQEKPTTTWANFYGDTITNYCAPPIIHIMYVEEKN